MNKALAIIILFVTVLVGCRDPKFAGRRERTAGHAGEPADLVNVFLGSSGDHGQLSPAASYPFSMMSIGPQTYPATHTGYEFKAKEFLGFTHTRFEGVGCQGSGGNILIKPFLGESHDKSRLWKKNETAGPGYYQVKFGNGIEAGFTVCGKAGAHRYRFPGGEKGFYIDLGHAFVNRFVDEEHSTGQRSLSGWVETKTTCSAGKYKLYYYLEFSEDVLWTDAGPHRLTATINPRAAEAEIRIAFSSVNAAYAKKAVIKDPFEAVKKKAGQAWNDLLGRINVKGEPERVRLFYSLLYRAIQSPYQVSEEDGYYKAVDGSVKHAENMVYNGWAIWDNYRTQLPLLSLAYPDQFQDMATSIANLYRAGKKDWATDHEPSPTVRTEHAIVVLLDAYCKGYTVDFESIIDSLVLEQHRLDYTHPDKALEASYDTWALAEIFALMHREDSAKKYKRKALAYKDHWKKDFQDLRAADADRMQARGLYQGTIWQYRWFVPFDVKGLMELTGGETAYLDQLDEFFERDYYNHANQPDLQVPMMYHPTAEPWKSQALIHKLATDTVVQHYFNDNSRGTGSFIGAIYKNRPEAYIRTMDDDAGTMSSWYVWASCGLFPACVGWPVYYLHAPLMEETVMQWPNGKKLTITVENYDPRHAYIKEATFNGKPLERNWLTHRELTAGGELVITSAAAPNKNWGVKNPWVSGIGEGSAE